MQEMLLKNILTNRQFYKPSIRGLIELSHTFNLKYGKQANRYKKQTG